MARFVRRVSPMLRIVVFALAALLLFSLHTPVSADGEIGDLVWKAAAAYNSPTGSEYPVIAFSADGTKLAVPMGFNQVGIFTAATGELQQKLAGHTDIVRQVAFSGDGKWLATGGEDMTIRIWKADAGFAHHRLLTTHTDKITGLSFSSDSTKLLSSGKDGKMLIWDTTPWTATQLADPSPTARDGSAISPNGLWAAARYARTVKVWSVQSGTVLRTYTIDAAGLSAFALAWAPNSTTLAVSAYRFVNLYNVLGADTPTAVAAETMGYSLAFSPDNKFLAVGLNAAQTRLYDPGNGYAQYTRSIVGGTGIAFSPDSTRMTAASSGVFRVYDPTSAASQVIAGPIFGESCMVRAVVPSADGQSVFLAGSANYVEERNASDGTSLRTMLIGAITQVSSLALSPDGAWLAVGASTGAVVILNAQTGAVAKTLNTGSSVVMSLAFDPTSTKLLTGSQDKLVKIWNFLPATPTHTVLGPPSTHDGHVTGVAYTSDGGKIVTIGSDSVIKVWTAAGENIWTSENLGSSLTALALSPDGALIAVGNNAGATKLFSTTTGADVRAMAGTFAGTVNDLAFTPDGAYLIGVGLTDAIVLWDAATGAVAGSATKACTTPLSVTLARGSATMVVGGDDGIGAWTLTLGAPRPDLSARSAADAGYTGVGIVNATGASQIVTAQASADMPATYDVRVANPYYQNDAYTLQGPGGGDGWTVAYYDALHADITAEIIAGTWSTGVLAPGLTAAIRAMVTPDNTVVGLTKSLTITATSQLDPLAVDVVKLNTISPIGPGASVRVSIHTDGSEGNADSQYPAMNADGTRVAFQSDAATLVDDDTNGARDIFLRRRDTGATARVSLGAGGAEANGDSWAPAINGDGTVVAFVSDATNLVAGDTNAVADIFVHDTATGITERVSLGMADEDANAASAGPALSADGTLVVFISEADNLVPGDTNECADVFLYNRTTGVTTRLSVNALGEQANAACRDAEISADGTTVAFSSLASNLATGDTNDTYDIFVVTLDTGAMVCASRSWEGAFGDDGSFLPKLSADGRYVAFTTRATNLLLALGGNGGDTNGKQDVYLCDLEGLFGPSLTLVSATALEQGNGDSGQFGLDVARDDEGTVYVVFESSARNLLGEGNDTNNKGDIFLWSQAGGLSRQSVSTLGEQANEVSRHPVISGDASIIAFDSRASNLVADDANEAYDAFVHVRGKAWQPDLLISSSADPTTFTGLNLFTLNAEQTLDVPVNTAVEKKFYVKLYNQVTNPVGSFALKVPAVDAATGWTLKYEDGGVNVTAAITGAGYPVVDMPPGAEKIIVVTARTYASSPEAAALTVQITATSVDDVSRRDVVQAIVRLTPYQTILASVNSSGGGMGGDDVGFSANGRYVCFVSGSSIQRHDRITGLTTRVDVSAQGATPNSGSADQDVSADGHLVIFKSAATNLVNPALPDGTKQQIQLKDMESGAVTIVSRASGVDGDIANDLCGEAVISPNGKYVAFASRATNLVPGVTDGKQHVYRRELEHPYTTRLVSVNNAGTPSNGDASSCGISSDGNFITWRSNASNLADLNGDGQYDATDDGNSVQDVFLHDVAAGTTELISVKHDGTASGDKQSSRDYRSPVSDDGRYVAFSSLATDLIDGQPAIGGKRQIFLRDRQAGLTSLISLDAAGDPAAADCERPTISLNGRYIGFATGAALLPFDDNALDDVYIVDRDTPGAAGLDLVSVPYNYNGATHTPLSNMKAQDPFISGDGRYIAFEGVQTDPTNLVPTNPGYTGTGGQQIYVRDRWQLAPDLMVKLQGGADWTGENTIDANVTPAQTLTPLQTEPGATATFALRLVNTGTTTDDIAITGTGGGQGWTVRYLDANDADVTAAVTGDGLLTLNMATNDVVTLTCVVTSDPFTLTGSQLDVVVTATSQRNTATRDRVKASARIAGAHKADLQIRSTADEAFLGDNVYDDGTEQTKTLAVQGGRTATYVVRIENDGGSGDDSYKLWAGQPGAGWTARFYAPDGTDITEGITNPLIGWTTDALAMGDFADIRITVTPSPSLGGGAFAPITISAQSWNDGAAADAVIARTQVAVLRQPDLIITAPAAQPVGDGVYDDGAAQTVTAVVQRGTTISYAVTLQNDGNVVESLPVLGTAGDADWTILYTETTGGANTDVTLAVVAGTWQPLLGMGDAATLRVDVTPRAGMAAGVTKTVTLRAVSPGDAKKKDTVVAKVTTAIRKPDLLVKVAGAPLFIGDNVYAPTEQRVAQSVDNGAAAAYPVILQNDGNTGDTYALTLPADGGGWTYRLYLGTDTVNEITAAVRGGSWETLLAADAALDLLLVAVPDAALLGGTQATATLTAASKHEPLSTDVVTITTTVAERHQGDALIQHDGEAEYLGDNQYAGVTQVKAQPVRGGIVATYRVKVENDGNVGETFTLFGDAPTEGWTVTYTDEATGTPITPALTGAGLNVTLAKGASATYLIAVSANPSLGSGALSVARVTVKIGSAVQDVVTAQTQLMGATARVSVDSLGAQGNNDSPSLNSPATISADGRYVAFSSSAANLVAGDTNSVADIFVHDRELGTTTRVSVSSGGAQGNGASDMPAISPDGRYVAFRSRATNLVAGDTNSKTDVFRHDRETGTTIRVSVRDAATQATGDSGAYGIAISTGGQFVVFESEASNLVAGDTNNVADIFLRDVTNGQTLLVSAGLNGAAANNRSQHPAMSADGGLIVYGSYASNLVAGDTNTVCDVFLYDRALGTTTRVSKLGATQGNGNSDDPAISGDGAFIAYTTLATNLASGDTNGTWDVMRVSRLTGVTTCVSAGGNGASTGPALNGDGRFVAYRSYATNLAGGDTNGKCDAFVYDANGQRNHRASLAGAGAQGNGDSALYGVALDSRGYLIAFDSLASNLVPGDTNNRRDVFVREWPAFQPDLAIRKAGETAYLGESVYYDVDMQTKKQTTPPGVPAQYVLTLRNDGMLPDTYTLQLESAVQRNWTAAVTGPAGQPIPALTLKGGAWTVALAGGESVTLSLGVTPGVAVAYKAYQEMRFSVSSALMPDRSDVICAKTQRWLTKATLEASPAGTVLPGRPVTLTATPVGLAPVEYRFVARTKDAGGQSVENEIRGFQADPTYTWVPDTAATYALRVYVRELGRVDTTDATVSYLVVAPLSSVTLSAKKLSPQAVRTTITLSGKRVGGMVPEYQYEAAFYDPQAGAWGPYVEIRGFSTTNAVNWLPKVVGTYKVRVNVREQNYTGDVVSDEKTYVIVPALTSVQLAAAPSPGTVGLPVTLTATPTGGSALEYRFLCYVQDWEGNTVEQEIRPYGTSPTATWIPTSDHIGTVTLVVHAREHDTTVAYKKLRELTFTVRKP